MRETHHGVLAISSHRATITRPSAKVHRTPLMGQTHVLMSDRHAPNATH